MPIKFEEEDEYSEGMDVFTEQMRVIDSEATTIGPDVSMSVTLVSERTRALSIQRAAPPSRSLSPMDIDSGLERMQVDEAISPGLAITATRASRTSAVAVPSKRPTNRHDLLGQISLPSSPSTLPQPAKRFQMDPHAHEEDFGHSLDPFFIAYDASVQPLLDAGNLAWGTIYEIARGVTKKWWAWSSVTREKLDQLRGTNADAAHRVAAVMLSCEVPRIPVEEVWIEYDREQDAIMENKARGLGGMGAWKGKDNWYGGCIQQIGRLDYERGTLSIQLEKPEIRRSHRFSRFLGSRRILQVRVKQNDLYKYGNKIRSLFSSSKFVLCGRVFLPFHAKEGNVYLVETNQHYERTAKFNEGDQFRISLRHFIKWHNPLGSNDQQPISKWSTRWALGLSTSIPTIKLEWQHIYQMDDINVSPQDWEGQKAPAEKVLTDGCGFINGAALTQIMRIMGFSHRPTAVQGRISGSKGMWVLHPDPLEQVSDGPVKIWIRPSQTKIKLGETSELGPGQLTLDLLAASRVFGPSHLSSQTLINLSYNGIDHQLLKDLMSLGMREEIQPFIDWTHPHSMILVWKAVEKAGKVIVTRLRRQFAGQARALGLGQLRPIDNQDQESEEFGIKQEDEWENGDILHSQSSSDAGHKSSPKLTLHECVLELIQAGFHPLKLEILFKKLKTVITLILDDYLEKFHIPIIESCEAYIIPDPYGVLEEGEIHFKPSEPFVSPSTGEKINIILGNVLVSRNPTRLPSDVQKVKAVAHPKLSNYYDVIVFPIKGKQSLASFLGGGDYDGDTVMLNWHKPLVEQFRGSSLCTAPSNLSEFFERKVEHVRDFDKRVSDSKVKPRQAQQALQEILLLGLAETRVGLYSNFHDSSVYKCGYGSPNSIHLAYMFTTCLDASKTGLRVKEHVFEQDKKHWTSQKPWYKWMLEQKKPKKGSNDPSPMPLRMYSRGKPFILDALVEEGEKLKNEFLQQYGSLQVQFAKEDPDLSGPWYAAKAKAAEAGAIGFTGFKDNLKDINTHVEKAREVFHRAVGGKASYEDASSSFAESPAFRNFVFFSDDDIQTLKASCASTKSLTFAFSVALRDLCTIKSRTVSNVSMLHQFAQCMTIPNIVARTLSHVQGVDT